MEQKQKRAKAAKTQKKQPEQYAELYNDLPQEVQNILMDTHPFKEKNEPKEKNKPQTKQQTRRPQREDVEEVREARMQQVGSELNEMKKAPQQEGAPTKYASRRTQSAQKRRQEAEQRKQEEAEFEEIQFVSMVPARKKANRNPNQTTNAQDDTNKEMVSQNTLMRRWRKQPEESPFPEWQNDTLHTRYETLDFAEREKQEHLDSLYENEYEDDGFHLGKSKVPIIIAGIGLLLLIFLIFKTVTLSSRLHEAEIQMKEVDSLKQRYEQVQLEKMQLEEELQGLQNPDGQKTKNADKQDKTEKKEDTKKPEEKKETQTSGANTENYTVLDGETPWDIAKKVYGNGAQYQKILDANGLKEGDPIRPGDVLKVPKS